MMGGGGLRGRGLDALSSVLRRNDPDPETDEAGVCGEVRVDLDNAEEALEGLGVGAV